jgi:low affinity Fe/Cu permease
MTAGQIFRKSDNGAMMPSDVSGALSVFDRFAARASDAASRARFFTLCILLVALWAPSVFVLRDIDTWQLIINTITTIITFLLVALLRNAQNRQIKPLSTSSTRLLMACPI